MAKYIRFEDGSKLRIGSAKWKRVKGGKGPQGGKSNCGGSSKASSPTKSQGQCTSGGGKGSRFEDGSRRTSGWKTNTKKGSGGGKIWVNR